MSSPGYDFERHGLLRVTGLTPKPATIYMLTGSIPGEHRCRRSMTSSKSCCDRLTARRPLRLEPVACRSWSINTPTEVDHYQLRRVFDVYVMPKAEDLSTISKDVDNIVAGIHPPHGTVLTVRGSVNNMNESFKSRCYRPDHFDRARLPHSDGAVRFLYRSLHHPA